MTGQTLVNGMSVIMLVVIFVTWEMISRILKIRTPKSSSNYGKALVTMVNNGNVIHN